MELLDMFDFTQNVTLSTHRINNILDLVITSAGSHVLLNDVTVHNHILSDHYTVRFKLNTSAKLVKPRVGETGDKCNTGQL